MKYDLEERVGKFGECIVDFVKTVKIDLINKPIIVQLVKSATSVGANYMEANQASSKKDFINKIRISQKEANESKHWLRMLTRSNPEKSEPCKKFWQEAHELVLIFAKISRNSKQI
ncbi:MAG: four helix bundle protein [Candidatus Peribacteraceae bacterium]|nr:four helix bundle protein [Candidatus Peribacteraceae bacterium]